MNMFVRSRIPLFLGTLITKAVANGHVRRRLKEHFVQFIRRIIIVSHLAPAQLKNSQPPEEPPGTWSNLLSICTRPDYRGKGIGGMLMEGFRSASERRGYKTMRLSVHNDNDAAIALYRRNGWEPIWRGPSGTYLKRKVREE